MKTTDGRPVRKRWKDFFLSLLFPPVCTICGERVEEDGLCGACRRKYAEETFARCPICGKNAGKCLCGTEFAESLETTLGGSRFLVLSWYVPAKRRDGESRITDRMILSLKNRGTFADFFAGELAREIGRLFETCGEDPRDWTVGWCPRSPEKFMETGFDQGEELAVRLAKRLGCGSKKLFVRSSRSEEQKELGAADRKKNAEDSLSLKKNAVTPGEKILLTDDIITTGSTIRAAASLLLEAGASAVFPVALARTMPELREGGKNGRPEDRSDGHGNQVN